MISLSIKPEMLLVLDKLWLSPNSLRLKKWENKKKQQTHGKKH